MQELIRKEWRKFTDNPLGWSMLIVTITLLGWLCWEIWQRFEAPLRVILHDRGSIGLGIGFLVLLYFLLISARASKEPQYASFLQGRFQEVLFLQQQKIFLKPVAACIVFAIGYNSENLQFPTSLISFALALASIYDFIKEVSGVWLRPSDERYNLQPIQATSSAELIERDREIQSPEGFRQLTPWRGRVIYVPGTSDDSLSVQNCLTSPAVNLALQDDASPLSRCTLVRMEKNYALPPILRQYAETALINLRAKGSLLHNDTKIRLASDLASLLSPSSTDAVAIQRTSYYDSVCSNELTTFTMTQKEGKTSHQHDLFDMVRRPETGELIRLSDSELSNHLGGGTLALTLDGQLLISRQGRLAAVAAGLLAPAGSGSFDWADQAGTTNLAELVKTGVERELREECSLDQSQIQQTIVLGMARDLDRGGKPDFYAITLLREKAQTLQPRIAPSEVNLVDYHQNIFLSANNTQALREELQRWLAKECRNCSPALTMNMHLLIHASENTLSTLLRHMKRK